MTNKRKDNDPLRKEIEHGFEFGNFIRYDDMAAFAEQTGNALMEQGTEGGKHVFYLKKA